MPVVVKIPTPLRKYSSGRRRVELPAGTVGEVLSALVEGQPELKSALFEADGQIKSTIRVFVAETPIEAAGGLSAEAADGQTISIIPPVAGA